MDLKKKFFIIFLFINLLITMFSIVSVYRIYDFRKQSDKSGIKILSVNLLYGNNNYDAMINLLQKTDPDIIVFIEYSRLHGQNLDEFISSKYKYTTTNDLNYVSSIRIVSKYNLKSYEYNKISNGFPGYIKTKIEINQKEYTIYGVHTSAPLNQVFFDSRNLYLDELSKDINQNENVIVAGDFNTTPWSYYYRFFVNTTGLINTTTKNNVIFTWTQFQLPLITAHIDHIFINNNVSFSNFEKHNLEGSDHDAVMLYFE